VLLLVVITAVAVVVTQILNTLQQAKKINVHIFMLGGISDIILVPNTDGKGVR